MQLAIKKFQDAKAAGTLEVADAAFNKPLNHPLIHQVVTAFLAKARQGTQKQKTRAEVRGGGKKPWRQKGTGRARVGSIRSPIWVGGGVAHAARPRSYDQKVNKKAYGGAIRSILSELVRQNRLLVLDEIILANHKTKGLLEKLSLHGIHDALIVTEAFDENLTLAARNIPTLEVVDVSCINPVNLIGYEQVVVTVGVIKQLEERLA